MKEFPNNMTSTQIDQNESHNISTIKLKDINIKNTINNFLKND